MKKLLHDWAFRNLTIFGKITVVKTLALPILEQCLSVLPDPKSKQFEEIQKLFLILSGTVKLIKSAEIL